MWWELRVLREKDGHSITSLAKTAQVGLGYLCDLENGRREPTPQVTKKIATALGVPVSVLKKDAA